MKILFDHQIFELQKYGGISRYFFELMREFSNISDVEYELSIKYTNNEYIKQLYSVKGTVQPQLYDYERFRGGHTFCGKKILSTLKSKLSAPLNYKEENKKRTIEKLKQGDFDIFHPTYFDDYFLNYLGNKPYVITIYDMVHEIYPEYFILNNKEYKNKRNLVINAKKVIAISENTRRDIIDLYGLLPEKVNVIHLAVSLKNKYSKEKVSLPEKYLLFVGNRTAYKNFYFFIFSIRDILIEYNDLYLICTGSSFTSQELQLFDSLDLRKKIVHFPASDISLALLYSKAIAFVFPSLYEGFGLPILEAFNCGCPVLLCNSSSFTEVAGDAALYFDGKNIKSIREIIISIISDEKKRKLQIAKGYDQLKYFSWERTANKTKMIYKAALL